MISFRFHDTTPARQISLGVGDLSHRQFTPQWECTGVGGILLFALPPSGCSRGWGSPPAQDQDTALGHTSPALPWWSRVRDCSFTAATQEMAGQRTILLFIFRQISRKGCVLHEETFIVEKA